MKYARKTHVDFNSTEEGKKLRKELDKILKKRLSWKSLLRKCLFWKKRKCYIAQAISKEDVFSEYYFPKDHVFTLGNSSFIFDDCLPKKT